VANDSGPEGAGQVKTKRWKYIGKQGEKERVGNQKCDVEMTLSDRGAVMERFLNSVEEVTESSSTNQGEKGGS